MAWAVHMKHEKNPTRRTKILKNLELIKYKLKKTYHNYDQQHAHHKFQPKKSYRSCLFHNILHIADFALCVVKSKV